MRTQPKRFLSLLLTAFMAVLSGCGQNQQANATPKASEPEVTVITIVPEKTTLTTVLTGRTSPFLVAEVRPQVGGIVQKRLFKEGSTVKAGEVLYQIDSSTYQAAYQNAKAALTRSEATALPARLKGERYSELSKVNAVSKQENDEVQASHRQADAEINAAKANLDAARINLSYTRVTTPIAGRIGMSSVTPGALVTANQSTALATVQQVDPIYVDVTQSSSEVMRLKRDLASGKLKKDSTGGAKVTLLFEDGTPYSKEGVLQFSDITVDQNTGVITLRALFPNPDRDLLPGLYVRAVLEEGVEEQAILVPQPAVTRDTKGNALVMVVQADGTVAGRPITLGRVVGTKWLVTSGLAAGDKVIVDGLQKARPGAKVKMIEAAATAPAGNQNATSPESVQTNATTPATKAEVKNEPTTAETPVLPTDKTDKTDKTSVKAKKGKPSKSKAPSKDHDEATNSSASTQQQAQQPAQQPAQQ